MTDEELKTLVAENSRISAENSRTIAENSRTIAENSRTIAENSRAIRVLREESEQQFRAWRQESERVWQEVRASREASRQESERIWQEVLASRKDFDRTITSLRSEIGHLGNSIGDFTESLLRPSLERLLSERFGMKHFHAPLRLKSAGEALEIDLVGHAKDEIPEVYTVEIKRKLRSEDFDQLFEHLRKLPRLVPEHRGKKLFGMLAALQIDDDLRARANREGIYLAQVKDDLVELTSPDDFEPQAFGLRGLG